MAKQRVRSPQVNMRLGEPVEDAIALIGARLGIRHRVETVRFLVAEKCRTLGIPMPGTTSASAALPPSSAAEPPPAPSRARGRR
jgi:hypothetical protein